MIGFIPFSKLFVLCEQHRSVFEFMSLFPFPMTIIVLPWAYPYGYVLKQPLPQGENVTKGKFLKGENWSAFSVFFSFRVAKEHNFLFYLLITPQYTWLKFSTWPKYGALCEDQSHCLLCECSSHTILQRLSTFVCPSNCNEKQIWSKLMKFV